MNRLPIITALLSMALPALVSAQVSQEVLDSISIPDKVETSIGTLNFFDGVPDDAMSFHLGRDDMLKTLEFVTHKEVDVENDGHRHFEFDLAKDL